MKPRYSEQSLPVPIGSLLYRGSTVAALDQLTKNTREVQSREARKKKRVPSVILSCLYLQSVTKLVETLCLKGAF